jgi:transcriptional regulator with XRE-family HTH domain
MAARRKQVQPRSGPERAFGEALREIRDRRDLSQEELADRCESDRTTISMLERGLMSPTLRMIARLSKALNVLPSEVMQRAEKSKLFHL